jgi:hypothetical protein
MLIRNTNIVDRLEPIEDAALIESHESLIDTQMQLPIPKQNVEYLNQVDRIAAPAIIIDDAYILQNAPDVDVQNPMQSAHLIVMVHGYQGNNLDMRLVK